MQGMIVEAIGTFCLVLVILAAVYSKKSFKEWAPLAIGTTLGFAVMVGGPLTGGSFNPARWFGPALVGNEWGDVWPYLLGPIVGSLLAAAVFKFVLEAGGPAPTEPPEPVKPQARKPDPPKKPEPPKPKAEPAWLRRLTCAAGPRKGPGVFPGPVRGSIPVACSACGGSPSRVTTRCRSRGPASCYCKYCAFATHQGAHPFSGGGRGEARRGRAPQRQGAARAHRRAARGQRRGRRPGSPSGATTTSPPTSSGPASGRWSAASCLTRTSGCSPMRIWAGCAR